MLYRTHSCTIIIYSIKRDFLSTGDPFCYLDLNYLGYFQLRKISRDSMHSDEKEILKLFFKSHIMMTELKRALQTFRSRSFRKY